MFILIVAFLVSLLLAGAYALVCRHLHVRQVDLLYKPCSTVTDTGHAEVLRANDVVLRGWVDNPGQPRALLYYGGASEIIEDRRAALDRFFPNHTRYFVPYRGFGPNAGLAPNESALKKDAVSLFLAAAARHGAIDVIGRSLGTSMASHVAAHHVVRRLVLITPFYSVISIAKHRHPWLPVRRLLSDWHEVWRDVSLIKAPVMAVMARIDTITPHKFWIMLRDHFTTLPSLFWDETADHSSIAVSDPMWASVAEFLDASSGASGLDGGEESQ